jgi:cyclic pyranopterin phosphate synthase
MSEVPQRKPSPVIPIVAGAPAAPPRAAPLPEPLLTHEPGTPLTDALHRPLRDLRISVTDRCNFRCGYCMPRSSFGRDHVFLPHADVLSFEEITRAAKLFMPLGVRKLRLTGGEPLLRKDLERLVAQLAELRTLDGTPPELTLTTNGILLKRKAAALKAAGLQRVTVSLDALDNATFQRMSDTDLAVQDVLDGIEAALAVGLGPIKVNMVVQKGVNDDQILPLVRHFKGTPIELRFIEFMDVGHTNGWQMQHVMPSNQVRELIHAEHPLVPVDAVAVGATAERWAHADGQGHLGFISSVTQAFCGDCNRLRLSTDGSLYTCLFASRGHDLRAALRTEPAQSDAQLSARLAALWSTRQDRYSELRSAMPHQSPRPDAGNMPRIEMSYIGG